MKTVLSVIESVYDTTLDEFQKSEKIEDYFEDEASFFHCIEKQKKLLEMYVVCCESKTTKKIQECIEKQEKFYLSIEFPYILLMKYLNILKYNAIRSMAGSEVDYKKKMELDREISYCLDSLKNLISQIFITKESQEFKKQVDSKFKDFQLFHHHLTWVNNIVGALLKKELKSFPLVNSKECSYSKVMMYPESLMICMDASLCKEVEFLHETIHQQAETLYRFYARKEYLQAYFIFKEFMENVEKLLSLLKDLYYLTHTDLENSFFQLIELLSYTDKEQILTILDIRKVKQLNNRYGEREIDQVIKNIENFLKKEMAKEPDKSLVVRGVSASFYMLEVASDIDFFEEKLLQISQEIKEMLLKEHKNIDIEFTLASFRLDRKVKYHIDELRRIILELKNRAKKVQKPIFLYKQEDQDNIRKWLNEKYFTIHFLQEKIQSKAIDVMLQPIYITQEHKMFAVEALARVKDEGRLLPAGLFIDTLYEMNLVTDMDILVLDAILEKREYIIEKNLKVFINSAASSLSEVRYIDKLYGFLEKFPPKNIIIEVTEQQALDNLDVLKEFHKKTEVKFAIDDFGTRYSALKTVSEMVEEGLVEVLKMDGSLISNLDKEKQTQKIVKIIAKMCETFEIYSLAEFIENEETLELLKEFDVDLSQGYFLSKPIIAEELRAC